MEAAEAETEAAKAGVVAEGRGAVGRIGARVGWWWQWRQGRAKRAYLRACKKRRVLKRSTPRWKWRHVACGSTPRMLFAQRLRWHMKEVQHMDMQLSASA